MFRVCVSKNIYYLMVTDLDGEKYNGEKLIK